jgi:hypothetical protein
MVFFDVEDVIIGHVVYTRLPHAVWSV